MNDRKVGLLAVAFMLALLVLGGTWWSKQSAERDARIDKCVSYLGEQGRAKCEQMEAAR